MPQKINMFLLNSKSPISSQQQINKASLGTTSVMATPKSFNSALNAPFIARVHNAKPGCGACGRH